MSILLCSLLRGVGYDAFVVSGYAARQLTLMDETHVDADINKLMEEWDLRYPKMSLQDEMEEKEPEDAEVVEKRASSGGSEGANKEARYRAKAKLQLKSRFLEKMEEKKLLETKKEELLKKEQLNAEVRQTIL
jgi:hypothetical protein